MGLLLQDTNLMAKIAMAIEREDWLMAHKVVIDCDRKRVTTYTLDGICVMFQGDKHDALP